MSAIELNDKRQIVIDLSWLLSALNDEQKRELVDSLACEDAIISDISSQLLDGWTERASHGAKDCGAQPEPRTPLDKARREIANRSGEVAANEIADLKSALCWSKACEDHYRDAYFKLYHAWPDDYAQRKPDVGSVSAVDRSIYEVRKKGEA